MTDMDVPVKRTAVLVVHGMGSQRPLDTVRGVVEAVWLDQRRPTGNQKRFWLHPQLSGTDVDLSVFTTTALPTEDPTKRRRFDFHELYWAHLMSETRTAAVLLWLFELGRRGPFLHPRMNALWWGAATFLTLLILSVSFLLVRAIQSHAELPDLRAVLYVPILMLIIVTILIIGFCLWKRALKFALWTAAIGVLLGLIFAFFYKGLAAGQVEYLIKNFFPVAIAFVATWLLMGKWGLAALAVASGMSIGFMYLLMFLWSAEKTELPWSLDSPWSVVAAWIIIGLYLVVNAAFLLPYLGDAARYFRNSPDNVRARREIRREAVDTLEELHICGKYDRIIIVAHSLGTVVAYDMLRAYFGRVCPRIPTESSSPRLKTAIDAIDRVEALDTRTLRRNGREIVREVAAVIEEQAAGKAESEARLERAKAWLVTDFVTLGSPLTHALYLMSRGKNEDESRKEFHQTTEERQYPTCPPALSADEARLTYYRRGERHFHHGAVFGITRWTNLYFPMAELIWGDAIGGEVAPVFGPGIVDLKVSTFEPAADALFTHVTYWDITRKGERKAAHIRKLRHAVNLEDDEAITPEEAGMVRRPSERGGGDMIAPGG